MMWIACSDRVDWSGLDLDVSARRNWCQDPVIPDEVDEIGMIGCVEDLDRAHLERRLRSGGFDPLGVPVILLSKLDRAADSRIRAKVMAAGARAEEYLGSGPEHLRPVMPPVVSRRSFLSFRSPSYQSVPHPDDSCVAGDGCRACVDVCPHGALDWSRGAIQHDRLACAGCGRCITICPIGAMVNPAYTPAQIHAELVGLAAMATEPFGVAFRCDRGPRPEIAAGWFELVVPCVAMLPAHWVLGPLLVGAAAVAVEACRCGREADADERVREAVEFARLWLSASDIATGTRIFDSPTKAELAAPIEIDMTLNPFAPDGAAAVAVALGEVRVEGDSAPIGIIDINAEACTGCEMCTTVCPTGALQATPGEGTLAIVFDPSRCTACFQCTDRCPEEGAIQLRPVVDSAELAAGLRSLVVHELTQCVRCGGTVAPAAALKRIAAALGDDPKALKQVTSLCLDCRGTTMVF